ncbi:hypothetical protein K270103H11_00100 [Gordonibacter urolithinfaciens]
MAVCTATVPGELPGTTFRHTTANVQEATTYARRWRRRKAGRLMECSIIDALHRQVRETAAETEAN